MIEALRPWSGVVLVTVVFFAIVGTAIVLVDDPPAKEAKPAVQRSAAQWQAEAEQALASLRSCVKLAEETVNDFERTARSRDRWKRRALVAEAGRAS